MEVLIKFLHTLFLYVSELKLFLRVLDIENGMSKVIRQVLKVRAIKSPCHYWLWKQDKPLHLPAIYSTNTSYLELNREVVKFAIFNVITYGYHT